MEDERDYGWALDKLRDGYAVRRQGWNGKGLSVRLQVPDEHSKMTAAYTYLQCELVYGGRVPWVPSQTDHLAYDWELAE